MNKLDTTEFTLDYIKIMGRECFSDYSINLQKQYKALASLGQKDAIVRYLENQIKNNDATILPEVAEIVNPIIDGLDLPEIKGEYVLDICSKGDYNE